MNTPAVSPPVPAQFEHPDALKEALKARLIKNATRSEEKLNGAITRKPKKEEEEEEEDAEEETPAAELNETISTQGNDVSPAPVMDCRERVMSTNSAMTVKPLRQPPPVPDEESTTATESDASTAAITDEKPAPRRYSIPPPPRPLPPAPEISSPILENEEPEEDATLPSPTENGVTSVLNSPIVAEPEEMSLGEAMDQVHIDAGEDVDDGADSDSSSSSDGKQTSFRSALSRTVGSGSGSDGKSQLHLS